MRNPHVQPLNLPIADSGASHDTLANPWAEIIDTTPSRSHASHSTPSHAKAKHPSSARTTNTATSVSQLIDLGEWAAEDRKIAGKPAEDATPKHIDVEEIEAMLAQQSDDFFKH